MKWPNCIAAFETASWCCIINRRYFFSRPALPDAIADMLRTGASLSLGEAQQADTPCVLLVDDEANILSALKRPLRREVYG